MGVGLLVLGVAFLVAEIFLPSGLFGVSGFISFIIGIFMIAPNVYFAVSIIALSLLLYYLFWQNLYLKIVFTRHSY